ncbi:hypothetical protein [Echinicola strongylocentroti]|nr:hypothetical protein [Echinicola strongylocentroti]
MGNHPDREPIDLLPKFILALFITLLMAGTGWLISLLMILSQEGGGS